MLQIAATELEKEESRKETEKQNYLSEHCPPLHIPGSTAELQVPPLPQFPHRSRRQARGSGQSPASGWPLTRPHPPCLPQELCKQLHAKVDAAEEEKYDMEVKVQKSSKEVSGRGARGKG